MKILLDNIEVAKLVPESLPMLIHGEEGSGASMYTIALAAKWFEQGHKIIFLCGYPMAEEEFTKLVGQHKTAVFYTKDRVEDFKKDAGSFGSIVVIKNIELFDEEVIKSVTTKTIIISGDINKTRFKDQLLKMPFASEVYFSQLEGKTLPPLEKYEGRFISGEFQCMTKLEK